MDWVSQAKELFASPKPDHFTNRTHCEECAEHDDTLRSADLDTIGVEELGSPAWDPICFCSPEGKKYYLPAFIRLSLETIEGEFYLEQFLFHLRGDGKNNDLFVNCSQNQRSFISNFLSYVIENYAHEINENMCTDEVLNVYEIWTE